MTKKLLLLLFIAALPAISLAATTAVYDTVSIYDIQYVPDPATDESSPLLGDTVVVKGLVMHSPRELYVGERWACYVSDGTNNPWSGFFIIQDDTTANETLFGFVQPGDQVYFTGFVTTYNGLTQLNIPTNPAIPVTIVSGGNPLPEPKVLTVADIADVANGEQWESMLVTVENVTITGSGSSWHGVFSDGSGTAALDDYFLYYRNQTDNGVNPWPPVGTRLNATGFTRDLGSNPVYYSVNPRNDNDLELLSNPPSIEDVVRNPVVPTSADDVTVTANITDNQTVQEAKLFYSVDNGPFMEVAMSSTVGDEFAGVIPKQADGTYVRYMLTAVDDESDATQAPGDTTESIYHYVIRDGGLSIMDIQYTWGYEDDASPFQGAEVTVEGVVTTSPTDYPGNYYVQSKDSAWYGIWIYDNANTPNLGDWVSVTGTVQERYGVTRIRDVSAYSVVTPNFGVFDPVECTTGELATGGANCEAYESVLVKVTDVTVTAVNADAPQGNYGEFLINDGSGDLRVDDVMNIAGNYDTTYALNEQIDEVHGIHYYSFGNYKLLPRNDNDIIGVASDISDISPLINSYELKQNYPNPFNPVTTIKFSVPESTPLTLTVFNMLGQKVKTLYDNKVQPGEYKFNWNGTNDAGQLMGSGIYFYKLQTSNVSMTKKMILMK